MQEKKLCLMHVDDEIVFPVDKIDGAFNFIPVSQESCSNLIPQPQLLELVTENEITNEQAHIHTRTVQTLGSTEPSLLIGLTSRSFIPYNIPPPFRLPISESLECTETLRNS